MATAHGTEYLRLRWGLRPPPNEPTDGSCAPSSGVRTATPAWAGHVCPRLVIHGAFLPLFFGPEGRGLG